MNVQQESTSSQELGFQNRYAIPVYHQLAALWRVPASRPIRLCVWLHDGKGNRLTAAVLAADILDYHSLQVSLLRDHGVFFRDPGVELHRPWAEILESAIVAVTAGEWVPS